MNTLKAWAPTGVRRVDTGTRGPRTGAGCVSEGRVAGEPPGPPLLGLPRTRNKLMSHPTWGILGARSLRPDLTPLCSCRVTFAPHRSAWLSHSIRGQGHPGSRRMAPPPPHTQHNQWTKPLLSPLDPVFPTTGTSVFKWKPQFSVCTVSLGRPPGHTHLLLPFHPRQRAGARGPLVTDTQAPTLLIPAAVSG